VGSKTTSLSSGGMSALVLIRLTSRTAILGRSASTAEVSATSSGPLLAVQPSCGRPSAPLALIGAIMA
jgi:hypothetical protein